MSSLEQISRHILQTSESVAICRLAGARAFGGIDKERSTSLMSGCTVRCALGILSATLAPSIEMASCRKLPRGARVSPEICSLCFLFILTD